MQLALAVRYALERLVQRALGGGELPEFFAHAAYLVLQPGARGAVHDPGHVHVYPQLQLCGLCCIPQSEPLGLSQRD